MQKLIYIIGMKASGKSSLADTMLRKYPHISQVDTFTDRKARYGSEKGHVFVPKKAFEQMENSGIIDVSGVPAGEDYNVGLSYFTIDKTIAANKVPLIVTRTPNIAKALAKRYPDSFGILLQIDPLTAMDRALARANFNPDFSIYAAYRTAKAEEQDMRTCPHEIAVHEDWLIGQPTFSLEDRPLEAVVREVFPFVDEYLKKSKHFIIRDRKNERQY